MKPYNVHIFFVVGFALGALLIIVFQLFGSKLLGNFNYYYSAISIASVRNLTVRTGRLVPSPNPLSVPENISVTDEKIILFWTTFFGEPFPVHGGIATYCPDLPCNLTRDRNLVANASALVFHSRDINWNSMPNVRLPHQRYIYLNHESAAYTSENLDGANNFFNWTATTRKDSDFDFPYGWMEKSKNSDYDHQALSKNLDQKTKPIAWFVSNCYTHSHRETLVQRLRQKIPVDVYGACGQLTCPRSDTEGCRKMVAAKYWFYIAFENSVCKDYVTEKFWGMVQHDIVLIVLNRQSYRPTVHPKAIIAVDDFANLDELVRYLHLLMKNRTAYVEHLSWKKDYIFTTFSETRQYIWCDACRRLWNNTTPTKSYFSLNAWYKEGSECIANYANRIN